MDGSTGKAGQITSIATFTLSPCVSYLLGAAVSGNQRGGTDEIVFGFVDASTNALIASTNRFRTPAALFSQVSLGFDPGNAFSVRAAL